MAPEIPTREEYETVAEWRARCDRIAGGRTWPESYYTNTPRDYVELREQRSPESPK